MKTRNVTIEPPGHRRLTWLRRGWFIALLSVPLVLGGCTHMFWTDMDPRVRMWIPAGSITEDQLRQEGRAYDKVHLPKRDVRHVGIFRLCDIGISREDAEVDGYLAEKSRVQKLTDRVVMVAGTPVTLGIDIVLVPTVFLLLIIVGPA